MEMPVVATASHDVAALPSPAVSAAVVRRLRAARSASRRARRSASPNSGPLRPRSTSGCTGTDCPLAKLGFVDPTSRKGEYSFKMTMNEDVWILTPSIAYDYVFLTRKWGRMSFGGAVGAMILSTSQQIAFKAVRTDPVTPVPPYDALSSRVLQGTANSTNVTDIGPIFRLHLTYRPPPWSKLDRKSVV